jgi:hypothetical protein
MVDALRGLLANQSHFGLQTGFIVMAISFVLAIAFAVNRFNRIQM